MSIRTVKRSLLLKDRLQAGLNEDERKFLEAAEIADLDTVKLCIERDGMSPDTVDLQGRSALDLGVLANDMDMVQYLLERVSGKTVHKGLLCAAENDRERICEVLLEHPLYQVIEEAAVEPINGFEDVQEDIATPVDKKEKKKVKVPNQDVEDVDALLREGLLTAAKNNNYQIVKIFMLRGAYLEEPHDYFCSCHECTVSRNEDYKVYTTNRLDTYTALASPSYMVLTEEDPILAAFKRSEEFRTLAELEGENKQFYFELDEQCQNFTLGLLDQCQSSDEVKAILRGKAKPTKGKEQEEEEEEEDILPMVKLAMMMEQKKFVSHSQCQAQIAELWYSGSPILRYLNRFTYLMMAIPLGLLVIPLLSIVYVVFPFRKINVILNAPIMRFLSYTCSYLSFLVLVMVTKLRLTYVLDTFVCDEPDPGAIPVIVLVMMFLGGLVFEECKQVWESGFQDYVSSFWNVLDSTMLSLLLSSFVLELVVPLHIHSVVKGAEAALGANATHKPSPICNVVRLYDDKYTTVCPSHTVNRVEVIWEPGWVPDPELLSDVFFTLGMILSIGRFSFIMPANEALGTMLVSFRRTLTDLLKITGMFILVLIAFACGLSALYAPNKCMNSSFGNFGQTMSTLIWSLFGMGSSDSPNLAAGSLLSLTNNPARNYGTSTVGYYIYLIYVFIAVVVLLNLLIAVMSNTFQEVQDERDLEWKFARTELWLTFIEPGSPIPPPFNIIPSPMRLYRAWLGDRDPCWKRRRDESGKGNVQLGVIEEGPADNPPDDQTPENKAKARQEVMSALVRRYIIQIEREKMLGDEDASDDMLKRHIDRVSSKIEKKMEEILRNVGVIHGNVTSVEQGESDIKKMQMQHFELYHELGEKRAQDAERFMTRVEQVKQDVISRLDSDRTDIKKTLDDQQGVILQKWGDDWTVLDKKLDELKQLQTRPEPQIDDIEIQTAEDEFPPVEEEVPPEEAEVPPEEGEGPPPSGDIPQ